MTDKDIPNSIADEIFQWVEAVLFALIIATLIRGFVFERVKVEQSSMDNTLADGQHLISYKLGYLFSLPKRGEIVVIVHQEGIVKGFLKRFVPFPIPGEIDYIKRTIAIPGDVVDIIDGSVFVNGEKLEEPYAKGTTDKKNGLKFPLVVTRDKIFVLGDNRQYSFDSREFGLVDRNKVKGRAVFRILPVREAGRIN